jgi:mannosyltransferase OCH1-like enzyme
LIPFVSQIFLSDNPTAELPPHLQTTVDTVRRKFSRCKHTLFDGPALASFIAEHYDRDVVETYDALRPYSYKADLGRFCILNVIGGWYFDIAVTAQTGIVVSEKVEFLAFRDIQRSSGTSWSCQTAVLYARPDNPVLRSAIARIVQNRKDDYYGVTPLCPTGPSLLGEVLAATRGNPRHVFGDFLELTPSHDNRNHAFVLGDGTIVAWGKRAAGGDLTKFGVRGGNNYNDLWRARQIYGPQP